MAISNSRNIIMVNSVISEGTSICGEIALKGVLRIEGHLEGVVFNQGQVYISKCGIIKGDVHTHEMVIGGRMIGNIYAEKSVKLLQSANLMGNIYTRNIAAEKGSVFKGDCEIV